jgi:HK97 family phage major capsid protein
MGKPVLVSPSMPSSAGQFGIVFGDLSYFAVRCVGQATFRRRLQTVCVESGEALYNALLRVDAGVLVPASGTPAIIKATLK